MGGEVRRHDVDVVCTIFPDPETPFPHRFATQFASRVNRAGHARNLGREGIDLIDYHRIDAVLKFEDLAFDINRECLRQVAIGHRDGRLGNISHLISQISCGNVDVIRQVPPDIGDAFDLSVVAKLALRAHFSLALAVSPSLPG